VRVLLALALALLAAAAPAQDKPRRIGILVPTTWGEPATRAQYDALTERLRELGWVEGRTLAIEWRRAEGRYERLPTLAGELVKANVEVIVTAGTPAVAAAKRATATIPIVATTLGDAVASGFAESLAKPGRNITGFAPMGSIVYEKRLQLILEALPSAQRIGVVGNPDSEFFTRILPGLDAAAQKAGRRLLVANVKDARTLEEAFGRFATAKVGAVLVADDNFIASQSAAVAALALNTSCPRCSRRRATSPTALCWPSPTIRNSATRAPRATSTAS
jgi:putative ABC transport system substrate-binding protein